MSKMWKFYLYLFHFFSTLQPGKSLKANNDVTVGIHIGDNSEPYVLAFVFGGIFWGVVSTILINKLRLPCCYPSAVIPMGMFIGLLALYFDYIYHYLDLVYLDDFYMRIAFLPLFIFRVAFCVDVHTYVRSQLQIVLISVPIAILTSISTGVLMMLIISPTMTLNVAILFGSICTSSYSTLVVAFLREQGGQTRHTEILFEGESMLSLATGHIMVTILRYMIHGFITEWYHGLNIFLRLVLLSLGIGWLMGFIGRICIRHVSDFSTLIIVTLVIPYLTFYLCEHLIVTSPIIAVILVGVMMGGERTSLCEEMDNYITKFWYFMELVGHTLILLVAGIVFVIFIARDMEPKDYIVIVVTYFICLVTRFLSFLLFAPLMSRICYGMTFSQLLILVWGGLKGAINIFAINDVYHNVEVDGSDELGRVIYMNVFGISIISYMLNYAMLPVLYRVCGWAEISLAKETNMDNCVKHLKFARERAIAILKMDRFLSDANWPMVHAATNIKHPYKIVKTDLNEDTPSAFLVEYRHGFCPDCKKEVLNEPTPNELKEMMKEARMRILKAQRISFGRQYENGMLTIQGVRILIQAVEMAMDTPQAILELSGLFLLFKRKGCTYCIRDYALSVLLRNHDIRPPERYWRRVCYNIMIHKIFTIFIYIMIVLIFFSIVLEVIYDPDMESPLGTSILIFTCVFYATFVIEFGIKILGYSYISICKDGFGTYFTSGWNVLDFLVLLIFTANIIAKYGSLIIGFVAAQEEVLEILPYMIDHVTIKTEMKTLLEADRLAVTKELGIIQKDRPWIAITVKSKQAMTTVLNNIKETINELKVSGWADEVEHAKLIKSLNECYKHVRSIKHIQPSPPKVIFKEVAWLEGETDVADNLYEHVVTKKYDPGDYVCKEGEISEGIFVVVTGLLLTKYIPLGETLNDIEKYGILPIVDGIPNDRFDGPIDDYIVSGNTFGELCTLTGRPYNSTIIAETHCQVYLLSLETVKTAMKLSSHPINGLECRLWKSISIRLATSILMDVTAYQGATQNKIKFILERSFMPNLAIYKSFTINDMMKDIILIEGIVIDDETKSAYVAPKYIPRTVKKLLLPGHVDFSMITKSPTKLMIIPMRNVDDYDIMVEANQEAELMSIDSTSSRCLRHIVQQRPSIFKRQSRYLRPFRRSTRVSAGSSMRSRRDSRQFGARGSKLTNQSFEVEIGSVSMASEENPNRKSSRRDEV